MSDFDLDDLLQDDNDNNETEPKLLDGITLQPWQPLQCSIVYDYKGDNSSNSKEEEVFQIKSLFLDSCYTLVLSDLINVWYVEDDSNQIKMTHQILNPAIRLESIHHINTHLSNMICFPDQHGTNHSKVIHFHDKDHKKLYDSE